MIKKPILLIVGWLGFGWWNVWAAGLRTPFGECVVENLKIGGEYSLYKMVNLPLRVINAGNEPVDLKIDVLPPNPEVDKLRKGYEPSPDTSWIKLAKQEFLGLESGHEAVTDVIISIPNDRKYLGKRYQVYLWSRTFGRAGTFIAVGLKSRLLFSISSELPTDEELKKKIKPTRLANINFNLLPHKIKIDDFPLGKKVNLSKQLDLNLKVVNPNDEALTFRIRSVAVWEAKMVAPPGFEAVPDPGWLGIKPRVVKVKPNSIRKIKAWLEIPDEPKYQGKNYMLVIKSDVLEQEIPVAVCSKVFVHTRGGEKEN